MNSQTRALYWFYRRSGFGKGRSLFMAMPLWVSMVIVPIWTMFVFLLLIKIV